MNDILKAIKTIEDVYAQYLSSETDTVNLAPYDVALLEVHTVLEKTLPTQAKRDNMRCGNCRHHFKKNYCIANGDEWFDCDSCSYFEPKENENG